MEKKIQLEKNELKCSWLIIKLCYDVSDTKKSTFKSTEDDWYLCKAFIVNTALL